MDRRAYLGSVGAVVAASTLAGCTGDESRTDDGEDDEDTQYGNLSTSITDQPNDIDHFESLDVTIQGIWIKAADTEDEESDEDDTENSDTESDDTENDDTENSDTENDDSENGDSENGDAEDDENEDADQSSGRYYIEFEEPQTADLVDLQGDNTQLIDETEVEVGDYQFVQLDVSDTVGTLKDSDDEPDVQTPGNAPLQFKHEFEIRADETTRFIADFAPSQTGQEKYMIRPVASGTQVLYGDDASGTQVLYGDEEYDGGEVADEASGEDADEISGEDADETGGEDASENGGDAAGNES